jgi:hypothetical protein
VSIQHTRKGESLFLEFVAVGHSFMKITTKVCRARERENKKSCWRRLLLPARKHNERSSWSSSGFIPEDNEIAIRAARTAESGEQALDAPSQSFDCKVQVQLAKIVHGFKSTQLGAAFLARVESSRVLQRNLPYRNFPKTAEFQPPRHAKRLIIRF